MIRADSQRSDVAAKYEGYYQAMANVIRAVLASPEIDRGRKFDFLKMLMPSVWNGMASGTLASKVTPDSLLALAADYNAAPCTWEERGTRKERTRVDYHQAEDEACTGNVLKFAPADCDLIFDLGCGWGWRTFSLWPAGGPRKALYAAGDQASGSQACIEALKPLFPEMKAQGFSFDFLAPDFGAFPDAARGVLVFTFCAIEQVERIGSALFDALLERFPASNIVGVHIEPVSFQIPSWSTNNPDAVARDLKYAQERRYNQDLYRQIADHPRLDLVTAVPGLFDTLAGNSRALLVWKNRPQ